MLAEKKQQKHSWKNSLFLSSAMLELESSWDDIGNFFNDEFEWQRPKYSRTN